AVRLGLATLCAPPRPARRPNSVKNPTFVVSGLPNGAKGIYFRLTDKNVPTYNHGGGWVAIVKDGTIKPGAFTYLSPCPPDGSHIYEWSADARATPTGKLIKRAKASRLYP
ncbi:MAG: hypothetical protein WCO04_18785, partial [Pseudomonadota bacterium]